MCLFRYAPLGYSSSENGQHDFRGYHSASHPAIARLGYPGTDAGWRVKVCSKMIHVAIQADGCPYDRSMVPGGGHWLLRLSTEAYKQERETVGIKPRPTPRHYLRITARIRLPDLMQGVCCTCLCSRQVVYPATVIVFVFLHWTLICAMRRMTGRLLLAQAQRMAVRMCAWLKIYSRSNVRI